MPGARTRGLLLFAALELATGCGAADGGGPGGEAPSLPSGSSGEPDELAPAAPDPAADASPSPGGDSSAAGESMGEVINGTAMTPPPSPPGGADGQGPAGVEPPLVIPPGDGFFLDTQCFARCESAASDAEGGVTDGFGFELGASCVVAGSAPALRAVPCIPEPAEAPDVPPGDGFLLGDQCFPPCVTGLGIDEDGFGFELGRSCVLPASPISDQGIPCVPPPPEVTNVCPLLTCPSIDGVLLSCGCGIIPGLGERKLEIADAGGDRRFLASAMMETASLTPDYPFGDVAPGPDGRTGTGDDVPKTGGAANFGITKMNWTMIRQCHPAYAGLNDADFRRGAELNLSLTLDIQVYDECRDFFGANWFGGHRNGSAGLNDPNTFDIRRFQTATSWVFEMLVGHLEDDVQFFVSLAAI